MNTGCYSLKNIKGLRGHEGYGFTASLYLRKKRLGTVSDWADGGPIMFECEPQVEKDIINLAKNQMFTLDGKKYNHTADTFIGHLIDPSEWPDWVDPRMQSSQA